MGINNIEGRLMDTKAIRLAWNHCANSKEQATVYGLCQEVDHLKDELAQCQEDKENLRQKNAILRQRPDLPVDRIPACDELDELRQELESKRERLRSFQRLLEKVLQDSKCGVVPQSHLDRISEAIQQSEGEG